MPSDNLDTHHELHNNENELDSQDILHSHNTSGTMQKLPDFLSDGAFSGSRSPPADLTDTLVRVDSPFSDRGTEHELQRVRICAVFVGVASLGTLCMSEELVRRSIW